MKRNLALNPVDVPVALSLVEAPNATFQRVSEMLGVSTSTAHQSVERLVKAGLVRSDKREVVRSALLEFLEHGVRYAFPASLDMPTLGVPTAHSGPALSSVIAADESIVWPSDHGSVIGPSLIPLFRQATELPQRSFAVYWMLTLVDALRAGRLRERKEAAKMLHDRIYSTSAPAA